MPEKEIQLNNPIQTFWSRQFSQVREEGWPAVRRKTRTAVIKLVKMPFHLLGLTMALPVVLVVRLIRPFKLVRFGYLFAGRIGHFAFDVEYYLTEKKLGLHPENALDIFFWRWIRGGRTANDYFAKLTKRNLKVNPFVKYLFNVNNYLPGGVIHQYVPAVSRIGSRDVHGLLPQIKPQLKFTNDENKRGWEFLKIIGLNENDKYVCLVIRDSAYLKNPYDSYAYHNYRDSDIDTYEEAALALAEKGYWVFRMGKKVHKPFKAAHPRIRDYANSEYRSDFLDIWLSVNCYFSLMTNTGIGDVVCVYQRPAAIINALPLGYINTSLNPNSIWLPKKIVWADSKNLLTLKEQIQTGVIGFLYSKDYEDAGVELIDNTPEEITKTAIELEEKLTGKWQTYPQDKDLQNQFWEILKTWERFPELHGKFQSKMPDTFLRENHEWFLV